MVRVRVSRNDNFYFNMAATVGGTRRRLRGNDALCYLNSVIRGNVRIRHLRRTKLVAVSRRRVGRLRNIGILLHTRNRPPRACTLTRGGGVRVVSTAYPMMLRLRHHVGGRCIDGPRTRVIVFKGGKRTRILKLMKRARDRTLIMRGFRSMRRLGRVNGLSFGHSVCLCSRAAGDLSRFRHVVRCYRRRVMRNTAFGDFSAVYHRITGEVPGVTSFTDGRSIVLFIDNEGDDGKGILFGRYGDIGTGDCRVRDTRRVGVS